MSKNIIFYLGGGVVIFREKIKKTLEKKINFVKKLREKLLYFYHTSIIVSSKTILHTYTKHIKKLSNK